MPVTPEGRAHLDRLAAERAAARAVLVDERMAAEADMSRLEVGHVVEGGRVQLGTPDEHCRWVGMVVEANDTRAWLLVPEASLLAAVMAKSVDGGGYVGRRHWGIRSVLLADLEVWRATTWGERHKAARAAWCEAGCRTGDVTDHDVELVRAGLALVETRGEDR